MPPSHMTELAQRVVPVMQEYGLSAFVLVGYHEDADGKIQRVCIANTARNPAFEDGLRPIIHFAHVWGAIPPAPPAAPAPDQS